MDFLNYLDALKARKETHLELYNAHRPAECFNPSLRDGVMVWAGLRLSVLSLIAALALSVAS